MIQSRLELLASAPVKHSEWNNHIDHHKSSRHGQTRQGETVLLFCPANQPTAERFHYSIGTALVGHPLTSNISVEHGIGKRTLREAQARAQPHSPSPFVPRILPGWD